jgi:hypothetical protein
LMYRSSMQRRMPRAYRSISERFIDCVVAKP